MKLDHGYRGARQTLGAEVTGKATVEQRRGGSLSNVRVAPGKGNDRRRLLVPLLARLPILRFVLVFALLPLTALAQAPSLPEGARQPGSRLEGISKGVGMGRFLYDGTGITAFSFRQSDLRPGQLGPELGVSFFPEAVAVLALLFASDFGPAYNVAIPHATLLLKAGGSAITGIATDVVFVPGAHFGAGLVLRIDDRTGIRIDAARHFYWDTGETEAIWSMGFGFTSLRPPRL
jgi:hypothetical protein